MTHTNNSPPLLSAVPGRLFGKELLDPTDVENRVCVYMHICVRTVTLTEDHMILKTRLFYTFNSNIESVSNTLCLSEQMCSSLLFVCVFFCPSLSSFGWVCSEKPVITTLRTVIRRTT